MVEAKCPKCGGYGTVKGETCDRCGGTGKVWLVR